jgi:hypothetical protein
MSHSIMNRATSPQMTKEFLIPGMTVSREWLEELGYDARKLDDETMERVAHELGEVSFEQMFSETLEWVVAGLNIPRKRTKHSNATLLGQAHAEEIVRKGAQVEILGVVSEARITSATDHGILISIIDRKSKAVSHEWADKPTPGSSHLPTKGITT